MKTMTIRTKKSTTKKYAYGVTFAEVAYTSAKLYDYLGEGWDFEEYRYSYTRIEAEVATSYLERAYF